MDLVNGLSFQKPLPVLFLRPIITEQPTLKTKITQKDDIFKKM